MSDASFILQTLNSNLYYLRTIREFALNIQLAFPMKNKEYIETAKDFFNRCEDLSRNLLQYANGNVTKEALDNQIFFTNYTLDCEFLTEKLFSVDIDTTITEKEMKLTPGFTKEPPIEMVEALTEINQKALVLTKNFIHFCESIISKMEHNELFSFSYISIINAMLIEANSYRFNLERIIARDSLTPSFVSDYEYLFNDLLGRYSSFIARLIDPKYKEESKNAEEFSNEFNSLAEQYKTSLINPTVQLELKNKSKDITIRFKGFLMGLIQELLNSKVYFIIEATFLDNILTTANYFQYALTTTSVPS